MDGKLKEVISYLIFGVLTTVISIVVFHVCYESARLSSLISNIISWIISVSFAYVTNRLFVFSERAKGQKAVTGEAGRFFSSRIGTLVIESVLIMITVDLLGFNGTVMKICSNVIVVILNYVFSKLFVFRSNEDGRKN